ncbi:spc24 [Candida oxycetoniae]|uniref:Kinetochore protein Spc24 n=1 Tax=Candida oxycetoniae TaxID=497107 RepID=A0AAI9WYW1_9ASCO|nr:spc24 [Candida oxycetoniae]KAI3405771.1 spc24 [Candida oxycetoniae]
MSLLDTPDQKLQRLIEQLNLDVESQTIEQVEAVLNDTKLKRERELKILKDSNKRLSYEIQQKTKEINLLNKINDYNYELIDANSAISDYQLPTKVDKSGNIFQVIQIKLDELENLRMRIINETRDIQTSIANLTNRRNNLNRELNVLQEELNNPDLEVGEKEEILQNDGEIQKICLYRQLGIRLATTNNDTDKIPLSGEEKEEEEENKNIDVPLEKDVIIIDNGEYATSITIEPEYSEKYIADYIWDNL